SMTYLDYLHPFGDLTLMVKPTDQIESPRQFRHALMELELILSQELDAAVCVIGLWEKLEKKRLINVSSARQIPIVEMQKMIMEKQDLDSWMTSTRLKKIYDSESWTQLVYKSGFVVTLRDFEQHCALLDFFKELGLEREKVQQFLDQPEQEQFSRIFTKLQDQVEQAQSTNSKSGLFEWICCLFERFSPPGTTPQYPIFFPGKHGQRPFNTILDTNGIGLLLLPQKRDQEHQDSIYAPYYHEENRWDVLNGRSLLDPSTPIGSDEVMHLTHYAVSILRSHSSYILEKLDSQLNLSRVNFKHVSSISVMDPGILPKPSIIQHIEPEIKALIAKEAKELAQAVFGEVHRFKQQHGINMCTQMLAWLKCDKEVERLAREYYSNNRKRLRGDYPKMDEQSAKRFNQLFFKPKHWDDFPFVDAFIAFLQYIRLQTNSLDYRPSNDTKKLSYKVNLSPNFKTLDVKELSFKIKNLSPNFKTLVLEDDVREKFFMLLNSRLISIVFFAHAFKEKYPGFKNLDIKKILKQINPYFLKWDLLFRWITDPKIFELLIECIQNNSREMIEKLQNALRQELETQYKTPLGERENFAAVAGQESIELPDVRSYFDYRHQINDSEQYPFTLQKHLDFVNENHPPEIRLKHHKLFGEGPLHPVNRYGNLTLEVRDVLYFLIYNKALPNGNVQIPTYSDYWKFVQKNPHSRAGGGIPIGGFRQPFYEVVQNSATLESLMKEPKRREALQSNLWFYRLVKAYIPFFDLQVRFAELLHYLEQQTEMLNLLVEQKEDPERSPKEPWAISRYDQRLAYSQNSLKQNLARLKETVDEIRGSKYFKMLKYWEMRKHLLEVPRGILPKKDQIERAFASIPTREGSLSFGELAERFESRLELQQFSDLFPRPSTN
ncbi:MAG: hypothetical protein ACHQUC_07545, partial [Chlamydiales bacterium]